METTLVVTWIAASIMAGIIADSRGRNVPGFIFLSLLFSPVIGLTAAIVAAPNVPELEGRLLATKLYRRCGFCAELMRADARTCRHCTHDNAGHDMPA